MSRRRCSSRSSTRISARSLASRLESGSSNSTTVGEKAMARASATRCCWPPESLEAAALGKMAHLHQVERALDVGLDLGRAQLAHAQPVGDVVEHRHVRPDGVGLEHHRHAALLGRDVAALAGVVHRLAVDADAAAARLLQAGDGAQRRGLAAARGAEQGHVLAAADREADAVDGHGVAVADDEILRPRCACALTSAPSSCRASARNRMTSATITVKVWISAIAAVSSVPLVARR